MKFYLTWDAGITIKSFAGYFEAAMKTTNVATLTMACVYMILATQSQAQSTQLGKRRMTLNQCLLRVFRCIPWLSCKTRTTEYTERAEESGRRMSHFQSEPSLIDGLASTNRQKIVESSLTAISYNKSIYWSEFL
jgi:hypothetical protein